jgi:hypothetical protein
VPVVLGEQNANFPNPNHLKLGGRWIIIYNIYVRDRANTTVFFNDDKNGDDDDDGVQNTSDLWV